MTRIRLILDCIQARPTNLAPSVSISNYARYEQSSKYHSSVQAQHTRVALQFLNLCLKFLKLGIHFRKLGIHFRKVGIHFLIFCLLLCKLSIQIDELRSEFVQVLDCCLRFRSFGMQFDDLRFEFPESGFITDFITPR